MNASRTTRPFIASNSKPLVIAHRGARGYAPENTIPAFVKALDLCNADGVELDVHLTKDNIMVVHHDDDLRRCTNIEECFSPRGSGGSYLISDYTLDEIQSLDAGSWFTREYLKAAKGGVSSELYLNLITDEERKRYVTQADLEFYASGRVRVPTLEQVLEAIKEKKAKVNIELKSIPRLSKGVAEKTMDLVHSMALIDDVLISSFDHELLVKIRQLDDRIATAILSQDRLAAVDRYLGILDADAYHPGCTGDDASLGLRSMEGWLDTTAIDACRGAGYGVNVWSCNEKDHMIQLIAAGVTGLITDFPNRGRELDG